MATLYRKIIISIFLVFFFAVSGFLYFLRIDNQTVVDSYDHVEKSYASLNLVNKVRGDYLNVLDFENNYLLNANNNTLSRHKKNINKLEESLKALEQKVSDSEQGTVVKLRNNSKKLVAITKRIEEKYSLSRNNNIPTTDLSLYIQSTFSADIDVLKKDFLASINVLLSAQKENLKNFLKKADQQQQEFLNIIFGGLIALFAILMSSTLFILSLTAKQRFTSESLEDAKNRLKIAIDATKDGIYDWDIQTGYVYYSKNFWQQVGYDPATQENTIDAFKAYLHHDDVDTVFSALNSYLARTRDDYDVVFRFKHKMGYYIWINSRGRALFNDNGDPIRMVGSHTDITISKAAEEQAESVKKSAQEANRAKSDFLAHMSHEIRTPLTAIIGIGEILSRRFSKAADNKNNKLVSTLLKSSHTLKDLVNDILDFSKIEAEEIKLSKEIITADEILEAVISIMSVKAHEKDIKINVNNTLERHFSFMGDLLRIKQILLNLVSNAIKFTPEGIVTLSLNYDDTQHTISFIVADTGMGIHGDDLDKVFSRFKQVDSADNRRIGGTGLGLPIARGLARLMGGDITVESTMGTGSTFTFTVPVNVVAKEPLIYNKSTQIKKLDKALKILICEDYEGNIVYLEGLLEELGCPTPDVALNGKEGLKKWLSADYDVILMDVQMPEKDGFETTKNIRAHEKEKALKATTIIGMTAHALVADEEKCINSGMDYYLPKPLEEERLIKLLNQL